MYELCRQRKQTSDECILLPKVNKSSKIQGHSLISTKYVYIESKQWNGYAQRVSAIN